MSKAHSLPIPGPLFAPRGRFRTFSVTLSILLAASHSLTAAPDSERHPAASRGDAAAPRLNVLFIAIDDLRPELGCYGAKAIHSPQIDRLAASGLLFERAYCQQAVCSPSRTSLMLGLRPDSTKIYDLETFFRDTVPDVITLSQHFRQHGYHTESIGKIYHGRSFQDDANSWSVPSRWGGGEQWHTPESKAIRNERIAAARAKNLKGKFFRRAAYGPPAEMADLPDTAYPDGKTAAMAIQAMERQQKADKPFFLAVGFVKPHLPFNAPKKYWDLYDPEEIALAPNPNLPTDCPNLAPTSWGELRNYAGMPRKGPLTDEQARWLIHGYRACVSFADAQVGKLLDAVERLGLAEDTVVVLWGDHGWKLGEHGLWCKHTNFELDAHAPLIFRVPGMAAKGQTTAALVEFVDIYPTLCAVTGLPLPKHLEGVSLTPLFDDPSGSVKPVALSQYPRGQAMGYSLRTDRYRYTEWRQKTSGKVVARELYDHVRDPAENTNLASHPEHAATIRKIAAHYVRFGL